MKEQLYLLLILVGVVSLAVGCQPITTPSKPTPKTMFPRIEMKEAEAVKLDPLLKQLIALSTAEAEPPTGLEELAKVISIHMGGAEPSVDVLIKTTDKAKELSDLGVSIQAKIGDIATANVPIERLPEIARLESVVYIEAAKMEK
jgi:hypothetical protein